MGRRLDGTISGWPLAFLGVWLCAVAPAIAQQQTLGSHCTVSAFNRSARVGLAGGWSLPNLPTRSGPVRVRATCQGPNGTQTGASEFIVLERGEIVEVEPIQLGSAPPIAERIELTAPIPELTAVGETVDLTAMARFPDGSERVLGAVDGLRFNTSNPAVLTVDALGRVTAAGSGVAILSATSEGALGVLRLRVVTSGDRDGDGIPDDQELALGLDPNNPIDAMADADRDGLSNGDELLVHGTNFQDPDSDGDTLLDGEEVNPGQDGFITSPLLVDTDGDLLSDPLEILAGSDPTRAASFDFGAVLSDLQVTPTSLDLVRPLIEAVEIERQLTVLGTLVDGSQLDLTETRFGTRYLSSDVAICNFGVPDGRVFGGRAGACVVTVRLGGEAVEIPVTVSELPELTSVLSLGTTATGLALSGEVAFLASPRTGLLLVDIRDRQRPNLLSTLPLDDGAVSVVIQESIAWLASGNALVGVDFTDPQSPREVARWDSGGAILDLALRQDFIYLLRADRVQVVDIRDPMAPQTRGQWTPPSGTLGAMAGQDLPARLAVTEQVGDKAVFHWLDVSDATAPTALGAVQNPQPGTVQTIALGEEYALLGLGETFEGNLRTVDLRVETAPAFFDSSLPAGVAGLLNDLVIRDDLAFGADIFFVNSLPIFDVADPSNLALRSVVDLSAIDDGEGQTLGADEEYLYLFASGRLYVVRYRVVVDNAGIAPSVDILSPNAGTTVAAGEPLFVAVDALDDIGVASVTLRVNGQVVGSVTAAPFSFEIVPEIGAVTLEASAVDFSGNAATSTAVTIHAVDNQPPRVTLTEPTAGATLLEGTLIDIAADASDADGVITEVRFTINGEGAAVLTAPPYAFRDDVPFGATELVIEVLATDDLGAVRSDQRTVPVQPDPLPSITLSRPAVGESAIEEIPLTLVAEASDNLGITEVRFFVDGTQVSGDSIPPYETTIDVPLGTVSLTLEAEAEDTLGQLNRVQRVVPVVASQPPAVAILSPVSGSPLIHGQSLVFEATATDDVGVTQVELRVDGTPNATVTAPPYRTTVVVPSGVRERTFTALATDTAGQTAQVSVTVPVVPDQPPTVVLTQPEDGRELPVSTPFTLAADADDDLGVDAVRFLVDGELVAVDTLAPFEVTVETPDDPTTLTLQAIAIDSLGQQGASPAVTVTVTSGAATTAIGRVVDGDGVAQAEATVTCLGQTASSLADGTFSVPNVAADQGTVTCSAEVIGEGDVLLGTSLPADPVLGGLTDVGDIVVAGSTLYLLSEDAYLILDPDSFETTTLGQPIADGFLTGLAIDSLGQHFVAFEDGDTGASQLGRLDPRTGRLLDTIGRLLDGFGDDLFIRDLAIQPGTDQLFALASGSLHRIHSTTAAVTEIAPVGVFGGLAFTSDGRLFAVGQDSDETSNLLAELDPITGGSLSTLAADISPSGLAARPSDDALIAVDRADLYTIDPATGVSTLLGIVPGEGLFLESLAYGPPPPQDPGTTLRGTVIDVDGQPLSGAVVECTLGLIDPRRAQSTASGTFRFDDVPSLDGEIRCLATYRDGEDRVFRGISERLAPVPGGTTDVGAITVRFTGDFDYPNGKWRVIERPVGLAAADVDGDGDDDLAIISRDELSILPGNGDTTFGTEQLLASANRLIAVQMADLGADGTIDIVTLDSFDNELWTLAGNGAGSFSAPVRHAVFDRPSAFVLADFDGDDLLDAAVSHDSETDVAILYGLPGGAFQSAVRLPVGGLQVGGLAAGDFDQDGRDDLAVTVGDSRGVTVMRSGEGRTFEALAPLNSDGADRIGVADLTDDGRPDIAIATHSGLAIYTNLEGPTFTLSNTIDGQIVDFRATDLDLDGRLDLVLQIFEDAAVRLKILLGAGGGEFLNRASYPISFQDPSFAIGDFNRDQLLDIAVSRQEESSISLLLGFGDGRLEGDQGSRDLEGSNIVLADFDADGLDDVAVTSTRTFEASVGFSNGDGTLTDATFFDLVTEPGGVAAGDLDLDGDADLIFAVKGSHSVRVYLSNGDRTFELAPGDGSEPGEYTVGTEPDGLVILDIDGNGVLDIATANSGSNDVSILKGLGDGDFQVEERVDLNIAGAVKPFAIVAADFEGDGDMDLATANEMSLDMSVLLQTAAGDFQRFSVPLLDTPSDLAATDFDRDGDVDLIAVAIFDNFFATEIRVARNTGSGLFSAPVSVPIEGQGQAAIAVGDANRDGFDDLYIANQGSDDVSVLRGTGTLAFDESLLAIGPRPDGLGVGDLDGDGRLDIVVNLLGPQEVIGRQGLVLLLHH